MMKKRVVSILCVISIFLVTLSGCGAPKDANSLFEKIDKAMNKVNSFEIDMSMELGGYINGTYLSATASGKGIEEVSEKDYYFYNKLTTTVDMPNTTDDVSVVTIEAYHGGNFFISNSGSGMAQKLYSPLSVDEAMEFVRENDLDESMFNDCTEKSFTKNDDKSYSLSYSGYSEEAVKDILEEFGFEDFSFDNKIEDMKINMNASSDYLIEDIEIEFVFSTEPKLPRESVFSMKMQYGKYDDVEKITDELSTDKFKPIEDVRLLSKIEDLIKERQDSDNGSFELELKQKVTVGSNTSETTEKDTVTYGVGNDGFFYEIDALIQKNKYKISYSNGTKTTTRGTKTETQPTTEDQAKEFIDGLIDNGKYSSLYVTNITSGGNGVYTITCATPNPEFYSATFASAGANYSSGSQTIEVTIKDDTIVSIKNSAKVRGRAKSIIISFEVESTLTFK